MEPRKYLYIDSLRGIAILMVVLYHCGQSGSALVHMPVFLAAIIDNGHLGVQLFFLVSAYTLMLSHYSRKDESKATRNFFIRRFFRIAPLYYLAIGYYFIQNFLGFSYFFTGETLQQVSRAEILANLFFINDIRPLWINHLVPGGWSVTVEFSFYLLLPLLFKLIKDINTSIIFLLCSVLLATILRLNHVLGHTILNDNNFLYWFFPNQLPIFAIGIFAFFATRGNYHLKNSTVLCIAATALCYCYLNLSVHFIFSMAFCLLLIVLSRQTIKLLVNKFTASVGKISFSLYLTHFAVLYWLQGFHKTDLVFVSGSGSAIVNFSLRFCVVFVLSTVLSFITYHLVEVPFQKLGKRLIAKLTAKTEVAIQPL